MGLDVAGITPAHDGGTTGLVKWFFGVPFRRQTYRNLGYLLLAFPLGIAYFVLYTVGIALSVGLAIVLVGFAVLALAFVLALALAGFERVLTNWLLRTNIEPQVTLAGDDVRSRLQSLLTNVRTWTSLIYLPSKFLLGIGAFVFAFTGLSTAIAMLSVPLHYDQPGLYVGVVTDRAPEIHQTIYLGWNYMLVGFEAAMTLGYWQIDTFSQALVVAAFGLIVGVLTLHICNGLAFVWGRFATRTLDGGFDPLAAALEGSRER